MPTWEEFTEWASHEARAAGGRPALRRRWERLRLLASKVEEQLPEGEVVSLLGKPASQLDPEENDVKALVA